MTDGRGKCTARPSVEGQGNVLQRPYGVVAVGAAGARHHEVVSSGCRRNRFTVTEIVAVFGMPGPLHHDGQTMDNHVQEAAHHQGEKENQGEIEMLKTNMSENMQNLFWLIFKMNPGKDKVIFNKEHPYFDVAPKDKDFAKRNFDLPIPKLKKD